MASFTKRKNADGSTTFLAQVRLKGYRPVARAFPDRAGAKRWAESLEKELTEQRGRGEVIPDVATLTLGDLLDRYLRDAETKALKSYVDQKCRTQLWVNEYANVKVLDFGVLAIRAARDKLMPGREPATVNRIIAALRSAWNWGRASGLIPVERVFPPRIMLPEPAGRVRHLSDTELATLLRVAEPTPVIRAAILVSVATGIRSAELLRLTWSDVDLDNLTLRLTITKNGQSRAVHMNALAADALRELRRAPIVHASAVFTNEAGAPLNKHELDMRWRKLRKAAVLEDFRWHDLRHSAASLLAKHGSTLLEIAHQLGHKSTAVTQRYSHLLAGRPVTGSAGLEQALRDAIEPQK